MRQVKSVIKIFQLLDLFDNSALELSVTEVANKLMMSRATAARIMNTMNSLGILRRSLDNDRKYSLGQKVTNYARIFSHGLDLKNFVEPYIRELNKKIDELVAVHIIKDDKRFTVNWIESSRPIRRVLGKEEFYGPLHAGAPGKLLLSYLPNDEINKLLDRTGLPRYTEHTITSKEELFREISKVRKASYAISKEEQTKHLAAVAAPVRNHLGTVIAALDIAWILIGNTKKQEAEYLRIVREVAAIISRDLGYQ